MAEKCKFKHVNLEVTKQICQRIFVFSFSAAFARLRSKYSMAWLCAFELRIRVGGRNVFGALFSTLNHQSLADLSSNFARFVTSSSFSSDVLWVCYFRDFYRADASITSKGNLWGFLRNTKGPWVLRLEKNHPSFNSLIALKLNRLSKEADYGFCLLSFTKDRKGLRGRAHNFICFKLRKAGRRFHEILLNINVFLLLVTSLLGFAI